MINGPLNNAGKESPVNTFQTNFGAMKMKRFLVCGLWIPMVAALVVMSIAGPMALAADAPPPPPPVTQELGYTQAQLAFKIATLLGFSGGDSTDAMNFLKNHVPPAVPLGGWDLGKQATVGDLTVCFCQLLGISPITPGGQAPTANDYQSAMLGIGVSNPASVQAAITAALPNWTPVGLSPFGPSPTNSPVRTQN